MTVHTSLQRDFPSPFVGEGCGGLANAVSLGVAGWVPPHEPLELRKEDVGRLSALNICLPSCGGTPHPYLPPQGGKEKMA